jgi:hypothetical protein
VASKSPQEFLAGLLDARAVVDLPAIREALGGKSAMTAFRHLRRLPYRRSYNHNGRYYARHVPGRYDRFGLWSHGDIHFSVDGSLKETVRRLVCEAEAGATQRELQERLRVRVHNTLLVLVRAAEVHRGTAGGVYAYFHIESSVREAQVERRREDIARAAEMDAEVDDQVIIRVLLVLIRHPGSSAADVARHLRGHSPPIAIQQVEAVFTRYELGQKRGASSC